MTLSQDTRIDPIVRKKKLSENAEFKGLQDIVRSGVFDIYTADPAIYPTGNNQPVSGSNAALSVTRIAKAAEGQTGDLVFTNLKKADGTAHADVTLTAAEVDPSGLYDRVELRYNQVTDTWVKFAIEKRAGLDGQDGESITNGVIKEGDSSAVSGGTIYNAANGQDESFPTAFPNYFLRRDTGAIQSAGSPPLNERYDVTDFIDLVEGETIYADVSGYPGASPFPALLCKYDLAGTFVSTIRDAGNVPADGMRLTYTATEDCKVRVATVGAGRLFRVWKSIKKLPSISDIKGKQSPLKFNAQLNHIIGYGQSLSTGAQGEPALTRVYDTASVILQNKETGAIVPHYESIVETPLGGIGRAIVELSKKEGVSLNGNRMIFTSCGEGGRRITELNKNTSRYNYLLAVVGNTLSQAQSENQSYCVHAIAWTQGESDYDLTPEAYKTLLLQLKNDLNADIKALTGQVNDPIWVMYQPSSFENNIDNVNTQLAYPQLALEDSDFICANPSYNKTYVSSGSDIYVHMNNVGYLRMGVEYGRALFDHLKGIPYQHLHIKSSVAQGKIITLVLSEDVEVDTVNVTTNTNHGFALSGNTISSISITGNIITIVCGSNVGAGQALTYAYNGGNVTGSVEGPRGNIRSKEVIELSFETLRKWLVHSKIIF